MSLLYKIFPFLRPREKTLSEAIAAIAETQIGVREEGGSNQGKDLQKYFDSDWYDPNGDAPGDSGYAWCASFVCWCVQKAVKGREITFTPPNTPRAWELDTKWSLAQDSSIKTRKPHKGDIKRGDILVFNFSHVGLAVTSPDSGGWIYTVEGNTNEDGSREGDGVYRKRRHLSDFRSRVRFMD